MQIDGKTQAIAFGVLAFLGFLAALTPSMFPSYIPAGEAADIAKTSGLLAGLFSSVGAACGLFTSSKPGPLAPPDHPEVIAAQAKVDADAAVAAHQAAVHATLPPAVAEVAK